MKSRGRAGALQMIPGGCSGGTKGSRRVSDEQKYLLTLAHRATEGIHGDDNFDVSYINFDFWNQRA